MEQYGNQTMESTAPSANQTCEVQGNVSETDSQVTGAKNLAENIGEKLQNLGK